MRYELDLKIVKCVLCEMAAMFRSGGTSRAWIPFVCTSSPIVYCSDSDTGLRIDGAVLEFHDRGFLLALRCE